MNIRAISDSPGGLEYRLLSIVEAVCAQHMRWSFGAYRLLGDICGRARPNGLKLVLLSACRPLFQLGYLCFKRGHLLNKRRLALLGIYRRSLGLVDNRQELGNLGADFMTDDSILGLPQQVARRLDGRRKVYHRALVPFLGATHPKVQALCTTTPPAANIQPNHD